MGRKSSKDDILDAAERVIRRHGMAATTIEGVAAEAGVSKGGLFYHFASKKEMLVKLLQRYQDKFFQLRRQVYDSLPEQPNRLLKASIIASVKRPANAAANVTNVLTLLDDVDLRNEVLDLKRRVFKEISEGYPYPEKIALAMLAADGLWVMDLFAGSIVSQEFQDKIIAELLALVDVDASAEGGAGGG